MVGHMAGRTSSSVSGNASTQQQQWPELRCPEDGSHDGGVLTFNGGLADVSQPPRLVLVGLQALMLRSGAQGTALQQAISRVLDRQESSAAAHCRRVDAERPLVLHVAPAGAPAGHTKARSGVV